MTSSFAELGLAAPLARALDVAGFVTPTPIQAAAIPPLLEGRDLLGLAQTGTGKTAAFVLPILQRLRALGSRAEPYTTRALILAPTRELAIQIHEQIRIFAKDQHFSHASVFGGVSINPQLAILRRGVDVLVATPGRLVDLIKQKAVTLNAVRYFVLDEADRMLDMGFIRDIKRITPLLPKERQSMLFSATMPREIEDIANGLLRDPARVEIRPEVVPIERIAQHVAHVPKNAKREAVLHLLSPSNVTRALVFARTKHGANRLTEYLEKFGCKVEAIHGNKSQGARQRALAAFKSGQAKVLVATDIAARGIDVANVSHVINAELPDEPESYVHRIGRTARAGREGIAITLCDSSERDKLRAIERLLKRPIPMMTIEGLNLQQAREHAPISDERQSREARGKRPPARGDRRDDRRGAGGRVQAAAPHAPAQDRHRPRDDDRRRAPRFGDVAEAPARQRFSDAGARHDRPRDDARPHGAQTPRNHRPGRPDSASRAPEQKGGRHERFDHPRAARDGARPPRNKRYGQPTA